VPPRLDSLSPSLCLVSQETRSRRVRRTAGYPWDPISAPFQRRASPGSYRHGSARRGRRA